MTDSPAETLSKWMERTGELEAELQAGQSQLAGEQQEAERCRAALAEALQELRHVKAEGAILQTEIETQRAEQTMFLAQMRSAQEAALNAQTRFADVEEERQRLDLHAQQLALELTQKQTQLDFARDERNELLMQAAQKSGELAELRSEVSASRSELDELQTICQRAQEELAHTKDELNELHRLHAEASATLDAARVESEFLQKSLTSADAERNQLLADVKQNHALSDLLAMKSARDAMQVDLRETQGNLVDVRERLHHANNERQTLRREAVDLQLKLAALRESFSDSDQRQDNEMLRAMVERLNEELKDRPARPKRRQRPEGRNWMGDLVRAVWSRCFISDPDVT